MVYRTVADIDFTLDDLPACPRPQRVLLTTPAHFDVTYVINPHMAGNIGTVDHDAAQHQWEALRAAYADLGFEVLTMPGAEGQPDMVFCANQTLPFYQPDEQAHGVVLSQMHAPERQGEVAHYERFFREAGYTVEHFASDLNMGFEGMGDALWHPGRILLWGGYGYRTSIDAYHRLAAYLDVPILALHLIEPDFYHLDTCLSPLDEQTALVVPGAFADESLALIQHVFTNLIEAPDAEARSLFACNAHSPDGEHVIIQQGCVLTCAALEAAGYTPIEVDTSEFLKAGGSVFCMKQMVW